MNCVTRNSNRYNRVLILYFGNMQIILTTTIQFGSKDKVLCRSNFDRPREEMEWQFAGNLGDLQLKEYCKKLFNW